MKLFGIIAAALAVTICYVGCNNNTQNLVAFGGLIPTYRGPGEVWSVFVNSTASIFELTHQVNIGTGVDYEGISSYNTYGTGFTQLTVTSAGPDLNGPSVGAVTSAVFISGYAFFLSPYSAADTMAMVPPVCPSADMTFNWIKLRQPSSWAISSTSSNSFGTMSFPVATGVASLVNSFNLDTVGNNDKTSDSGAATLSTSVGCGTGQYFDGNNQIFISSNSILVNRIPTNEVYFGISSAAAPSVSSLAGNYSGYLYQANGPANQPVSLTLPSTSGTSVTVNIVTDVTTGTTASSGTIPTLKLGNVTLSGTGTSGFIGGSINFGATDQPLVCLAQTAAGGTTQNMIACNGYDGTGFVSLILTSH